MRGWPRTWNTWHIEIYLSIHSLMRSWPPLVFYYQKLLNTFNSQPQMRLTLWTTSMRTIRLKPFNSQPHARLTGSYSYTITKQISFNSQPHTRLTQAHDSFLLHPHVFQFTASYEADQEEKEMLLKSISFQFTASYEADRGRWNESVCAVFLSIHSLIRGWPCCWAEADFSENFQFTASYEADRIHLLSIFWYAGLSIHSLRWGWPGSACSQKICQESFNSQPHTRLTTHASP